MSNMESEDNFKYLLQSLKGEQFLEVFKEHNIDANALKYMTSNHLDVIIPKPLFGTRIIFEHHLNSWQKEVAPSSNFSKQPSLNLLIDQKEFSIEAVLKSSLTGKSVLTYYNINKKLITKFRRMIARCVIAHIIENKISPSPIYFENIAENIVKYFTTENKDLYFIRKKSRKPGGCLYSKYHNSISNLKKEGIIDNFLEKKKESIEFEEVQISDESDSTSDKEWLISNIEPMCDVVKKWDNTFLIRKNFLKSPDNSLDDIFEEWPIYKQSFGHKLILADFSKLYPGKEHLLDEKWENFCTQIIKIIERDVKDNNSLDTLLKYKASEYKSGVRDCVILDLIHSVLKPASRKCIIIDKKKRKYEKVSVEDSKNSFLLYSSNNSELNSKIKLLVDECFIQKQTLQPFICAIGSSVFDLNEFYVYFGNIFYKLENIKSCVDLTFKIFSSINIKYPQNCNLIWLFIQEYFFEITVDNNERCTALSTILTDIQNI